MAQRFQMERRFLEWMRFQGTIERHEYVLAGGLLFALKHNLDRIVASHYGVRWSVFNYVSAAVPFYPQRSSSDTALFAALALVAIPFVWIGIALTEARLRRTGLPLWLALLFFVPFVNLVFFAVLCVLPPRKSEPRETSGEFALRSALTSIVVVGLLGVSLILVATKALATYGLGLFLGVPFMLGFVAAVVFNWEQLRGRAATFTVAFLAVAVVGIALEALAIEGLVCLLMALPLAAILAFAGALLAYQIRRVSSSASAARAVTAVVLVVPALLAGERFQAPPAGRYAVVTSIEINAPADAVWREVIAFTPITEPRDFVLRTGVAYPISAHIVGSGVGAVRYCVFNDGAFVEPIRIWDAPRRLAFDVEEQPDAMAELSPYRGLRPPHIAGQYFRSRQGEFLLTPLSSGRTRLQGTTWYEMRYWPQPYWRLWSDTIVHHIHLRVLEHIQHSAEAEGSTSTAPAFAEHH